MCSIEMVLQNDYLPLCLLRKVVVVYTLATFTNKFAMLIKWENLTFHAKWKPMIFAHVISMGIL